MTFQAPGGGGAESESPASPGAGPLRALLLVVGLVYLIAAALMNEPLLTWLDPPAPFEIVDSDEIPAARRTLAAIGVAYLALAGCLNWLPWMAALSSRPLPGRLLLGTLSLLVPISILEIGLKPLTERPPETTTIFVRDAELGWRLRPGTRDVWGGVEVSINRQGLRGPDVAYAKPLGVARILFLGDSVTFGYRLERDEDTFPRRIGRSLGSGFEAINAGVGGYSPWQQHRYLASEGLRYQPDLVVVSFVLNDVTEKFDLIRFGGFGEGRQLQHTAATTMDWLARHSRIAHAGRRLFVLLRLGPDAHRAAVEAELLDVEALAHHPDRPDVRRAWEVTLENFGEIVDVAREHEIPVLLAIFPYAFQFEDPKALSAPQDELNRFAASRGVPAVDLLPLLAEALTREGATPEDYFIDKNHLSVRGSRVVAELLTPRIRSLVEAP